MFRGLKALRPRDLAKWALYTLALLAPGSFAVLIILWLIRLLRVLVSRNSTGRTLQQRGPSDVRSANLVRSAFARTRRRRMPLTYAKSEAFEKAPRAADAEPNLLGGAIDAIPGAAG